MDALAVPSPKISMGTIYQVTKLMDDKHVVTHAGFLALPPPPQNIQYTLDFRGSRTGHRECGNVKKYTPVLLLKTANYTTNRLFTSGKLVWFTGSLVDALLLL